jgi:stalled ribosome rescue protein Dom34
MPTFHAVVWMDHAEAHVAMFDREHMQTQRIKSRSHHKHQGKAEDNAAFFADIANALAGSHEVLLTGPGLARNQFRDWCVSHQTAVAESIVDSVTTDHPSDGQLVALARQYFKKFDNMTDPATA